MRPVEKLTELRARLGEVRRKRRAARWALAYSALIAAAIWILATIFALDWLLNMTRPQRLIAIGAGSLLFIWLARRYALPWLGRRETIEDVALLVEQQQGIDSDLVAALQFESPAAEPWGSRQLKGAVVDYVAEYGQAWEYDGAFDRRPVRRRLALLAVTVGLALTVTALFPGHVTTFLRRLAMNSAHYPSGTLIDRLEINGQLVGLSGNETHAVQVPLGSEVRFLVQASGKLADSGAVRLTREPGEHNELRLARSGEDSAAGNYAATLPKLMETVSCEVLLGDAFSESISIEAIPLPIVDVLLTTTPPPYAQGVNAQPRGAVTLRQISVLEGSQVALEVVSANKPLADANAQVAGKSYELVRSDTDGYRWKFATPPVALEAVMEPVSLSVQITDTHGLQLDEPLKGTIRIRPDRKPTIVASTQTRHVLPAARPRFEFSATDDFGIAKVEALVAISRQVVSEGSQAPEKASSLPVPLDADEATEEIGTEVSGTYGLDLSAYKLAKGDQVKVVFSVTDDRGPREGQTETSEPITLDVTDLSGLYAAMYELEEKAYRQTGALIDRQTETGASQ